MEFASSVWAVTMTRGIMASRLMPSQTADQQWERNLQPGVQLSPDHPAAHLLHITCESCHMWVKVPVATTHLPSPAAIRLH